MLRSENYCNVSQKLYYDYLFMNIGLMIAKEKYVYDEKIIFSE